MSVSNNLEALFPRIARLYMLYVVLSIEHKSGLLVAGDLKILIGEGVEGSDDVPLCQELSQH